jgi:hypothetical protein
MNRTLGERVGSFVDVSIGRFKNGTDGELRFERNMMLKLFSAHLHIPVWRSCTTSYLELLHLVLVKFMGKEYILGQGPILAEIVGDTAIHLSSDAPEWCHSCGAVLPQRCPTCGHSKEHDCAPERKLR